MRYVTGLIAALKTFQTLVLRQWIVEVESEQPWVFSDYRCRNYVENIIVRFLWDFASVL